MDWKPNNYYDRFNELGLDFEPKIIIRTLERSSKITTIITAEAVLTKEAMKRYEEMKKQMIRKHMELMMDKISMEQP